MDDIIKNTIETYQCPSCVIGSNISCYKKGTFLECKHHVLGTTSFSIGTIFLGLQKPFCRVGNNIKHSHILLSIFDRFGEFSYDKFNIPCWKYFENGHTFVRGLSPRINNPWIHVYIGNFLDKIDCYEITKRDIEIMD